MKMKEILDVIASLACSQGFYGRLYNDILEMKKYDKDAYNKLKRTMEAQKFGDAVDVVMWIEG